MKKIRNIVSVICLLLGCSMSSDAQTVMDFGIDKDILTLRNDVMPQFRYHYDDWLQYTPAGVMVALKAAGHESRSSWGRMLVSDAFSAAVMAAGVNGIKYSVARLRPDGSRRNSFPSGHTATAFMTAAMLSKEYGWRSPWYSIGGYTAAAVTGVSRIMNNRHWLTDVFAGAAIGIGSVHLGYYLADLFFKDKHLSDGYVKPEFDYDPSVKHYVAEMLFARRFILGSGSDSGSSAVSGSGSSAVSGPGVTTSASALPVRGSLAGVSVDFPVVPGAGISARTTAGTLIYNRREISSITSDVSDLDVSSGGDVSALQMTASVYNILAGGYYNLHFAKRFELQAKVLAGYAWQDGRSAVAGPRAVSGWDLCAGLGLSFMLDSNFKLKAFADFESMQRRGPAPWLNSITLGLSTAWLW